MNVVLGAKLRLLTTLALHLLVFIVWFSFQPKDGVVVQPYIGSLSSNDLYREKAVAFGHTKSSCLINASPLFLFCIGAIRINVWALKSCDRNNLNIYSESYISVVFSEKVQKFCEIPSFYWLKLIKFQVKRMISSQLGGD